jgi:hypothetical protein
MKERRNVGRNLRSAAREELKAKYVMEERRSLIF